MIKAVLTDIEGTTSSISFVHETLFPFARKNLPAFVRQHHQEPAVAALIEDTRQLAQIPDADVEAVIAALISWIDADRKATPLKALQGLIWESGYRSGAFTAHIYDDALACLRDWLDAGLALFIFSSGSIKAQHLMFEHMPTGDLRPMFSGYFDTTTGSKKDVESYDKIAEAMGQPAQNIAFLSDVVAELDAAKAAGMQTWLLVRGEASADCGGHTKVADFHEIQF